MGKGRQMLMRFRLHQIRPSRHGIHVHVLDVGAQGEAQQHDIGQPLIAIDAGPDGNRALESGTGHDNHGLRQLPYGPLFAFVLRQLLGHLVGQANPVSIDGFHVQLRRVSTRSSGIGVE